MQFAEKYQSFLLSLALIIAVLAGGYWRLDHSNQRYFDDELIPEIVVAWMQDRHSLDTNWRNAEWSGSWNAPYFDLDQYNFSSWLTTLYWLKTGADQAGWQGEPLVFYRAMSLLCQALTLCVIVLAARRTAGYAAAVLAGMFFCLNPMFIVSAHYARPESFLMLIVALALALEWRAFLLAPVQKQSLWLWSAPALLWGVALACKISVLPMAGLCLLAAAIMQRSGTVVVLRIVAMLVGIFITAPWILLNPAVTISGVQSLLMQYIGYAPGAATTVVTSHGLLLRYLLGFVGITAWLCMALSLCAAQKSLRWAAIIGAALTLAYGAFFSWVQFFNEFNVVHLAAVWAWMFGVGVLALWQRLAHSMRPVIASVLCTGIAVSALVSPAYTSWVIFDAVYREPSRVPALVAAHDAALSTRYHNAIIASEKAAMENTESIAATNTLFKIPVWTRPEFAALEQLYLRDRGFVVVDELRLPLGDLPYSMLQVIHFPPAYRYYQLQSVTR